MNKEPEPLPSLPSPEQPPPWWQGIRFRMIVRFGGLFLLVLVLLELLFLFGAPPLGLPGRVDLEKENAFRSLRLLAESKKLFLREWLENHREQARILARQDGVVLRARHLWTVAASLAPAAYRAQSREDPARRELFARLRGLAETKRDLARAEIVRAGDGMVLASSDPDADGGEMAFPGLLEMGARAPDGFVHSIVPGHNGLSLLHATHPIRDDQGRVVAVLVLAIAAEPFLGPFLHTGPGLGRNGEVLLVNDQSLPLLTLKHPLPDGSRPRAFQFRNQALPARLAAQGGEGEVEALDYRGVPVLAAMRHIRLGPEWGWGMVVKVDRDEILAPLREEIARLLALGGLALAAVVLVTVLAANRVALPLRDLTRAAVRLGTGDLSARVSLARRDEVGMLARTFDAMAHAIEEAVASQTRQADRLRNAMAQLNERHKTREATLAISRALSESAHLAQLLERGLDQMMRAAQCQAGAIYLMQGQGWRLAASLGFQGDRPLPRQLHAGEGAVGVAAARQEPVFLEELPEGSRALLPVLSEHLPPRGMAALPMLHGGQVRAVALLVSIHPLSGHALEAVEQALPQFAVAIANAESHAETQTLAQELQEGNRELKELNEELKARGEELRQQARELTLQREQVEEANRLKSEFLSNMSHELRTPLNSILALSQLMISRAGQEAPTGDFLHVIERNGKRLLDLINDILDLSRIESGHVEIFAGHVEARALLRDLADIIRPLAEAKGLTLEISQEGEGMLRTDPDKCRQILLNLLSNAVKFTEQGWVRFSLTLGEDGTKFVVRDSGMGIDPADQGRIFDSFTQLDGSTTRQQQGTGLGLAICRKLTALLGGTLTLESARGHGAAFTLFLPHLPVSASPAGTPPPSAPAGNGRPRVLVVDDNDIVRMQIREILGSRFRVVEADGGAAAQSLLEEGLVPDLLILDLMMPGVNGFTLLNALRALPGTAQLPVVVLTAKELTADERIQLKSNHVLELIQKGNVNREKLLAQVERALTGLPAAAPAPVRPRRLSPEGKRGPDILLVEDRADNLLTLEAILAPLPYVLWAAENGAEALAAVREIPFALALMDMELPGMSGFEITRRLKADPVLEGLPVIAVTARAMKGDREQCLAAGCDGYLPKPLDPDLLTAMVQRFLAVREGDPS